VTASVSAHAGCVNGATLQYSPRYRRREGDNGHRPMRRRVWCHVPRRHVVLSLERRPWRMEVDHGKTVQHIDTTVAPSALQARARGAASENARPSVSRPEAHLLYAPAHEGRAPEDRPGDIGSLFYSHLAGHLLPRHTGVGRPCGRGDGGRAEELALPYCLRWRRR
jgi:hypothetical protein